jgi:uncharacterized protein (DUF305 family)
MKRTFSMITVPATALVLSLAAGGPGGAGGSHQPMNRQYLGPAMSMGQSMSMGSAPAIAGHNAQDVMFAQMMIPHHQQAIIMARQAATRASSPQVKKLAAQIQNAQQPEIDKMTGWLRNWGAAMLSPGGMHMGQGMMSAQDMKKLSTLSGKAFDTMFLQMMIKHHQGAITMAKAELAQGTN